jgi:putative CocE/NonD family hydrolase
MRQLSRLIALVFVLALVPIYLKTSQLVGSFNYERREEMIPMRDGVRLYTIIMVPRSSSATLPFILLRTPYSAAGSVGNPFPTEYVKALAEEGYIFVYQDIRGKVKSEGEFSMNRAWQSGKAIDETTDTYDTIEWLLKNVPNNNGRVGAMGISYPGWLTEMVGMSGHPAVKAVSPQAPMTDTWMGDDFFHQGAFRMSYGLEYSYAVESSAAGADFDVGTYDMYDWYLRRRTLADITAEMGGKLPSWKSFVAHPAYDGFWQQKAVQKVWTRPTVPTLTVGGWWDQEDFFGPLAIYEALEKNDGQNLNRIVVGPWNHGQWAGGDADSLGKIDFKTATGPYFREKIQAPFFAYYLKDKSPLNLSEATMFESGSNTWRSYDTWPPKTAQHKALYLQPDGKLSFEAPTTNAESAFTGYVSDPSRPVPYRPRPIQPTYYSRGSDWYTWLVEDQRFVHNRPDVVSWTSDTLDKDVVVAGNVVARLFASTSGSDADWVAKLIDVYPDRVPADEKMGGYQLMVSSDIMRGRYRASFEKPEAIAANTILDFRVDLHQQAYRFLKGHKIMVQIQSTWFPLYDRNPQTFVPNIFLAKPVDFRAQTHRVYHSSRYPSRVEIDIMPAGN